MIAVEPIAYVRSPRADVRDDAWGDVIARIELANDLPEDSLEGLDEFSHAEVIFHFHRVPVSQIERGTRHPRGNPRGPAWGSSPSAASTVRTGSARPSSRSRRAKGACSRS